MEEPSRTYADVNFSRPPVEFLGFCEHVASAHVGTHGVDAEGTVSAVSFGISLRGEGSGAPLGFAALTGFIADPAHVLAGDSHNCIGLQTADNVAETNEVIFLFLAVGSFTARAVEPHFVDLAVVSEELGKLLDKHIVIARRIAVGGCVAVPWRKVETEFHAIFIARLTEGLDYVALSVHPCRRFHAVVGRSRWPEAEAVVVFGCKHHEFEAGILERLDPLVGVEISGIEHIGIFCTVAPLAVGECVDSEVEKCGHLKILPCKLFGRGHEIGSHFDALLERGIIRKGDNLFVFLLFFTARAAQCGHNGSSCNQS